MGIGGTLVNTKWWPPVVRSVMKKGLNNGDLSYKGYMVSQSELEGYNKHGVTIYHKSQTGTYY